MKHICCTFPKCKTILAMRNHEAGVCSLHGRLMEQNNVFKEKTKFYRRHNKGRRKISKLELLSLKEMVHDDAL